METAQETLIHERIDDIPLLIATMAPRRATLMKIKLVEAIDKHVQVHGNHTGLSIGYLMVIWLAFIMSQGSHAKSPMEAWVKKRRRILQRLLKQPIVVSDFTDDGPSKGHFRLGVGLKYLSDRETWERIEAAVWQTTVEVYDPELEHVRLDASTGKGYHKVREDGIMQRGHSKDHRPDLPQLKMMAASAEPAHLPIAHDVVSGEQADDQLYLP